MSAKAQAALRKANSALDAGNFSDLVILQRIPTETVWKHAKLDSLLAHCVHTLNSPTKSETGSSQKDKVAALTILSDLAKSPLSGERDKIFMTLQELNEDFVSVFEEKQSAAQEFSIALSPLHQLLLVAMLRSSNFALESAHLLEFNSNDLSTSLVVLTSIFPVTEYELPLFTHVVKLLYGLSLPHTYFSHNEEDGKEGHDMSEFEFKTVLEKMNLVCQVVKKQHTITKLVTALNSRLRRQDRLKDYTNPKIHYCLRFVSSFLFKLHSTATDDIIHHSVAGHLNLLQLYILYIEKFALTSTHDVIQYPALQTLKSIFLVLIVVSFRPKSAPLVKAWQFIRGKNFSVLLLDHMQMLLKGASTDENVVSHKVYKDVVLVLKLTALLAILTVNLDALESTEKLLASLTTNHAKPTCFPDSLHDAWCQFVDTLPVMLTVEDMDEKVSVRELLLDHFDTELLLVSRESVSYAKMQAILTRSPPVRATPAKQPMTSPPVTAPIVETPAKNTIATKPLPVLETKEKTTFELGPGSSYGDRVRHATQESIARRRRHEEKRQQRKKRKKDKKHKKIMENAETMPTHSNESVRDLPSAAPKDASVPPELCCAINGHLMKNPVVSKHGGSVYEKETIERWIQSQGQVDPLSDKTLLRSDLVPAQDIMYKIIAFNMQQSMRHTSLSDDSD